MSKKVEFSDVVLDTKTGLLYVNQKPIMALIEENGLEIKPGGMNDLLRMTVTFFIRSYGEVDNYGALLAESEAARKRDQERLKELFGEEAK